MTLVHFYTRKLDKLRQYIEFGARFTNALHENSKADSDSGATKAHKQTVVSIDRNGVGSKIFTNCMQDHVHSTDRSVVMRLTISKILRTFLVVACTPY